MTSTLDVASHARRAAAVVTFAITFGLAVGLTVIAVVTGRQPEDMVLGVALPMFGAVGAVILVKQPRNPIGSILIVAGLAGALSGPGSMLQPDTAAEFAALSQVELGAIALGTAAFFLFVGTVLGILPIVFPSGRAISPRWQKALIALIVVLVAQLVLVATMPELCPSEVDPVCAPNPLGLSFLPSGDWVFAPMLLIIGMGIAAGVVRFRRSHGVERLQMKWVVFAIVLLVVEVVVVDTLVGGVFGRSLPGPFAGNANLLGFFVTLIPLAIGVSILRYRLYDIDHILKRTVSYSIVGAVLAGGFALVVLVPAAVLGATEDGARSWLVALATLVAFGLFDPVRRRVQRFVDRRFDREHHDARILLDEFGSRVRDVTDADAVRAEFATAVDLMLRPSFVSIWLSDELS